MSRPNGEVSRSLLKAQRASYTTARISLQRLNAPLQGNALMQVKRFILIQTARHLCHRHATAAHLYKALAAQETDQAHQALFLFVHSTNKHARESYQFCSESCIWRFCSFWYHPGLLRLNHFLPLACEEWVDPG